MATLDPRSRRARYSRGAVTVEYIFVLPLVVVLGITGFAYTLFAVTGTAFSHDTTRVAERAVRVNPQADSDAYCDQLIAFASDLFDQAKPFYFLFLKNIVIEEMTLAPESTGTVFRIKRSGEFEFLGMAKFGFPSALTTTGQAVLPVQLNSANCTEQR